MTTPSDAGADDSPDESLITGAPIIVCLGAGGVGKTTTAAAIGVAAAQAGRRAVVLTIDPARRLADAMGISDHSGGDQAQAGLGNDAHLVAGDWPGELWASMLHPADTFDDLIREHSLDEAQSERILTNRLYRNLTTTLSGTNEYMAAERLRSLHLDARFDVVVVDTPPSRHAFDFLDSPKRLTRFFDARLYRNVLAPRRGILKAMNAASQLILRSLSRVVGAAFVEDVIDFFDAFEGIDRGFRDRAAETEELLTADSTAYIVISAPRQEPLREARWISDHLRKRSRTVALLVVNRVTPRFDPPAGEAKVHAAANRNLEDLTSLADAEDAVITSLADDIGAQKTISLHELLAPVADLSGLRELADQLRSALEGS